jgi:hypothetical protein
MPARAARRGPLSPALLIALLGCAPPVLDGDGGLPTLKIVYPSAADTALVLDESCQYDDLVVVAVANFTLADVDASLVAPDRGHWHVNVEGDGNITMIRTGLPYGRFVAGPFRVAADGLTEIAIRADLRNDLHEVPEGADPALAEDVVRINVREPTEGACR